VTGTLNRLAAGAQAGSPGLLADRSVTSSFDDLINLGIC
jgi:hypothetical protein